jgi:GT2 family glycosyltransferase
MVDVTVVIVNYNTCCLLHECIQSIEKTTGCTYEIIIVDNASSDNSLKMLREMHPKLSVIQNKYNVGFARANNQGFSKGIGRYFFMLNPDTVVLDGAIDKLVTFIGQNQDVGICSPCNVGKEGDLQYNCDHFPNFWNNLWSYANFTNMFPNIDLFRRSRMLYWDYGYLRDVDRVMGCSLMIRSDLYRQLRGLDANYFMYFEETDLCYRSKKLGFRTVYLPDAKIMHYGGSSSKCLKHVEVFNNTVTEYFLKSQYYFYKKNYGLISMVGIRMLDLSYGLSLIIRNLFRRDQIKRREGIKKGRLFLTIAIAKRGLK